MSRQHRRALGGPAIPNTLLDQGFTDVALEVHTAVITEHAALAPILAGFADAGVDAGVVDREKANAWLADQER